MAVRFHTSFFREGKERALLLVLKIDSRQAFSKNAQRNVLDMSVPGSSNSCRTSYTLGCRNQNFEWQLCNAFEVGPELVSLSASLAKSSNAWDSFAEKERDFRTEA